MSHSSKSMGKTVFRKLIAPAFGLALLGTAGSAHAILIDNGTTTIDTATGNEWLDLTLTLGFSYNAAIASPFVMTDGYHVATTAEVCSLFTSLGDALPNCLAASGNPDPIVLANATTLVSLIGPTPGGNVAGIMDGGLVGTGLAGLGCVQITFACAVGATPNSVTDRAGLGLPNSFPTIGVFLVRPAAAVPEPNTMFLFGAGMVCLIAAMRRRRWKESI